MSYDDEIDHLIDQSNLVTKAEKERRIFVPRPKYDIQIPRWGQSKEFNYKIADDNIRGKKITVVIVESETRLLRWGSREHDTKKGPFCSSRAYHDPVKGTRVDKDFWNLPMSNFQRTIDHYKPIGSRKNPEDPTQELDCSTCISKGFNKSEVPTKYGSEDKCGIDSNLSIVVFKHQIEEEDNVFYKNPEKTSVGGNYLALLPLPMAAQVAFQQFILELATSRRKRVQDVLVELKIEEERSKKGTPITKLSFRELDMSVDLHQKAVVKANEIWTTKVQEAKQSKGGGNNPVANSSNDKKKGSEDSEDDNSGTPFDTGVTY